MLFERYQQRRATRHQIEQPELPLDTGLGPEAYFGWRGWTAAPDFVMDCNTTGPNPEDSDEDERKPPAPADEDRKPQAPDDSNEDCFTIKLAWEDHIRISAVELWHKYLNPTFAVKDNLYIQLDHGSKISCFPDPDAFYILRRQTMQLRLAIETNTDNYLDAEGVGHVGAIRRIL